MNKRRICLGIGLLTAMAASSIAGPSSSVLLAWELANGNDHAQAALEFRRLAMDPVGPAEQGAFFWVAGYEYWKAGRTEQAAKMLEQVEDVTPTLETEVYLLRGENSRSRNRPQEAIFYFESLMSTTRPEAVRQLATKKLSATRLQARDVEGARQALSASNESNKAGLDAIAAYQSGKDKSPVVGGLLGLIPGLGYAYSGEYASATRSLLLNALCIWGIVSFAEDETWGGVAVAGFAEVTFYSGSIYGGADSAVRYNNNRLQKATRAIEGQSSFHPDYSTLPVLSLQFNF
jgi:tetratricopeptide (TPR) repeat protein